MRQIKFRAWDKSRNKMLHFTQSPFIISEYNVLCWEVDEEEEKEFYGSLELEEGNMELMQFTGLKDKNGVEIFEGDVLEEFVAESTSDFKDDLVSRLVVIYEDGAFVDKNTLNNIGEFLEMGKYEILGNIYSNPDLIKT